MEMYEKPVMEVDEFEDDIISTSTCPNNIVSCNGGMLGYGGCSEGCTVNSPR